MIPILFESNETEFKTNGIGRLSDATSCKVTEERNGQFELEMEYPLDGIHYSDLKYGRFILATPSYNADPEPFEIYKAIKNLNGRMTFYARHISYRLSLIPAMPFTASTCGEAFTGLKNNAAEECPFTFYTDKSAEANFSVDTPSSIRSLLGGVQGSILDTFGTGEYKWEKYKVSFLLHRGETKAVSIRYGKNLTDLKQEESIENTITGIVPYWKGNVENQDVTVTLPEKVVYSDNADKFPYKRTTPVDFSSDFQEKPTEEQLRNDAKSYIKNNNIGVPSVNLTVSFVNLADTEEYKGLTDEDIRLCDTVNVVYEKLGITAQAKVIKIVWNVLKDSYDSIELGEGRTDLAISLVTSEKATEQKITNAREEASNRIKSLMSETGHAFIHYNSAGNPFEFIVSDDEDLTKAQSLWRWNEGGLAYSSTGYNGQYGEAAITKDGKINANEIQTGILRSYDDNENFYFNLNTGECRAKNLSIETANFSMTSEGIITVKGANINGRFTSVGNKTKDTIIIDEGVITGISGDTGTTTSLEIGDGYFNINGKLALNGNVGKNGAISVVKNLMMIDVKPTKGSFLTDVKIQGSIPQLTSGSCTPQKTTLYYTDWSGLHKTMQVITGIAYTSPKLTASMPSLEKSTAEAVTSTNVPAKVATGGGTDVFYFTDGLLSSESY